MFNERIYSLHADAIEICGIVLKVLICLLQHWMCSVSKIEKLERQYAESYTIKKCKIIGC
jgi:hypothetical protein